MNIRNGKRILAGPEAPVQATEAPAPRQAVSRAADAVVYEVNIRQHPVNGRSADYG